MRLRLDRSVISPAALSRRTEVAAAALTIPVDDSNDMSPPDKTFTPVSPVKWSGADKPDRSRPA